jgi:hypothetical protein
MKENRAKRVASPGEIGLTATECSRPYLTTSRISSRVQLRVVSLFRVAKS